MGFIEKKKKLSTSGAFIYQVKLIDWNERRGKERQRQYLRSGEEQLMRVIKMKDKDCDGIVRKTKSKSLRISLFI